MDSYKIEPIEGEFDISSLVGEAYFTQSELYGWWQAKLGRTTRRYRILHGSGLAAYFQYVKYPLPFGKSCLYMPYGPILIKPTEELINFIKASVREIALQEGAIFVRFDFVPAGPSEKYLKSFSKTPEFAVHTAFAQPREEWMLDLAKGVDAVLMEMDKKTRWSIKVSAKREVTTEIVTANFENYFDQFMAVLGETANRKAIGLHDKSYYQAVFETLPGNGYLSIAKLREKVLAANLIITHGEIATNVYGGSSAEERYRQAAYASQWAAITKAADLGLKYYNFGGVAVNQPHKEWDGITSFKKGFGGFLVTHSLFVDLVVSKLWYRLFLLRKMIQK